MKNVYLDNASTTAIRPEVITEMVNVLNTNYGNPSSTHFYGRNAKNSIELSRKSIAKELNISSQEIIFTSGGTEANNLILQSCVEDLKVTRIITSKIEHHAVLKNIEYLEKEQNILVDYVNIEQSGEIDMVHLSKLLMQDGLILVSLMHVNNEIGTILDIERVAKLCKQSNAYFHTDTIQSIGKIPINLAETPIDFLVASAHKFHGPKGIGFAFIRKGIYLQPHIFGGEQEKGLRAGTENIAGIVGMSKALNYAYTNLEFEKKYISDLKLYTQIELTKAFSNIQFIAENNSIFSILNVILPISPSKSSLLLFHLDLKGIAISRGSACQSGSSKPSHVLAEIVDAKNLEFPNLRISFSCYNTKKEIDYLVENLVLLQ